MNRQIDEDVCLTIASARQHNPLIKPDMEFTAMRDLLIQDWEKFQEEMGIKEELHTPTIRAQASLANIKRMAQAIARGEGKDQISERNLREARQLLVNSLERFSSSSEGRVEKSRIISKRLHNRVQTVKAILDTGSCDLESLWEKVKETSYFESKADLERLINNLHRKGKVFKQKQKYVWI